MSEWKEKTLNEIVHIIPGYAFKGKHFGDNGTSIVKIKDINPPYVDLGSAQKVDLVNYQTKNLDKYRLVKGQAVLAMTGATIGKIGILRETEEVYVNQRVAKIAKKDGFDYKFAIYSISGADFQTFIQNNIDSNSAQENISATSIGRYPVLLPPLQEQRAIASVLSSLDDKIDLLHRQNQTLEQMAETLFRQWFVERALSGVEADDDWEEGVLGDEFDFTMGQSPPGNSFNEEGIGTPMYQGNRDFGFRFPENRVFTTEPKRFAEKFDTLISVRAPVGEQNMANEKCCIGRGVAAFRYKANPAYYTYTFFKLKSLMDEIKQFNETGTVFGSISKKDFQEMEVTIPPIDEVRNFQNEVKPIDDKIISNCHQIRTLIALRDTLLPKLMSGEVSLSNFGEVRAV